MRELYFLCCAAALLSGCGRGYRMVALGDSITAASGIVLGSSLDVLSNDNSKSVVKFPAFSWATGDNQGFTWDLAQGVTYQVNGHYARLLELHPGAEAYNVAKGKPGQTSDDLSAQAEEAAGYEAEYATISIGGNDLCGQSGALDAPVFTSTNVPALGANVRAAIDTLVTANPNVKVLLLPVPDMRALYELGIDAGSAGADAIGSLLSASTCQERWDDGEICGPLLHSARTANERDDFITAKDAVNAELKAITQESQYASQVKYAESIATTTFDEEDVSRLDCYHPSAVGQGRLAEISWQEGWFVD